MFSDINIIVKQMVM